jgi:hypothetical protein
MIFRIKIKKNHFSFLLIPAKNAAGCEQGQKVKKSCRAMVSRTTFTPSCPKFFLHLRKINYSLRALRLCGE